MQNEPKTLKKGLDMTRPGVYLIKGRFGKEAGKVVGVCEAPPTPTHDSTVEEGMTVLQLWCGRNGLSDMALANYSAEFSPYVPWDSLSRTFAPIVPEKDVQAWYVAEFNVCVVVRAHSAAGAVRRATEHPMMKGKADRIRIVRHATADEVELHETMAQAEREEEIRRTNAARIGNMSS